MSKVLAGDADQRAFWQMAIETWQASGLSVRRFCRQEGLSEPSFYAWRKRLSQVDTPEGSPAPAADTEAAGPGTRRGAAFIQVAMPAQASGGIELVFASGHTMRIGNGTDRRTLHDVVAVLQEAHLC